MTGEIFILLLISHLIGDFIVQTDNMAKNKTKSWFDLFSHVITYHITMFLILSLFLLNVWLPTIMVILLVSGITHAFLDRRWPVIKFMSLVGNPELSKTTWGVIVVDQVIHISILGFLALLLG